jgi:hypothetical protein
MKEEYIRQRNSKNFDIYWLYKYFLENGGRHIDVNTFNHLFQMYDSSNLTDYLDVKFELTILVDKGGNFIKVVE